MIDLARSFIGMAMALMISHMMLTSSLVMMADSAAGPELVGKTTGQVGSLVVININTLSQRALLRTTSGQSISKQCKTGVSPWLEP